MAKADGQISFGRVAHVRLQFMQYAHFDLVIAMFAMQVTQYSTVFLCALHLLQAGYTLYTWRSLDTVCIDFWCAVCDLPQLSDAHEVDPHECFAGESTDHRTTV